MLQKSDPILSIDEEIFELLSLKKSSYPKGVYFALEACWGVVVGFHVWLHLKVMKREQSQSGQPQIISDEKTWAVFSLTFSFKNTKTFPLKTWRENLITDGKLMTELHSISIRSTEQ